MKTQNTSIRLTIFTAIILALIAGYIILTKTGTVTLLENGPALKQWILQLDIAGPLVIIGLMAAAIIMSPIPSAPIALAAGAAYGHTTGTVYIVIGAELGAILAFYIARLVGIDIMQKWLGDNISKGMLGSQNALMSLIFVSRLLPFISFDIVSYAAGVTAIKFWRFAIATLAGIIPASFLLAHFGSELATGEKKRIGITLLILGALSLIAALSRWLARR